MITHFRVTHVNIPLDAVLVGAGSLRRRFIED